ncbi:Serine/threonine protein kinase [Stygiomarasmius scandens]|uniref:non-specific serine/threonine protein kinase n=1 Tax=Marasmiellus scandens TaxID=2682957 RepID=A0ABR1JGN5_9AGAR
MPKSKQTASSQLPEYTDHVLSIPGNPLRFLELLGAGAFGKVYKAVSISLDSESKWLDDAISLDNSQPVSMFRSKSESAIDIDLALNSSHEHDFKHKFKAKSESFVDSPKVYAVKCLLKPSPGTREEATFFNEIRNHSAVSSHPNIVSLHDSVFTDDGSATSNQEYGFLVLEHCNAGDLCDALSCKKFDGDDEAIRAVYLQILDAVKHCHEKGVFHRDLKPENILLRSDGTIRLADFGLSTTNRVSGKFKCGSGSYMSPGNSSFLEPYHPLTCFMLHEECTRGPGFESTHYSTLQNDLWSLGIVLLNLLLCSRNPWHAASIEDKRFSQYVKKPRATLVQRFPSLSDQVLDILVGVLNIDPEARTSIQVLKDQIRQVPTFFKAKNACPSTSREDMSLEMETNRKMKVVEVRVQVDVDHQVLDEEQQWPRSYWSEDSELNQRDRVSQGEDSSSQSHSYLPSSSKRSPPSFTLSFASLGDSDCYLHETEDDVLPDMADIEGDRTGGSEEVVDNPVWSGLEVKRGFNESESERDRGAEIFVIGTSSASGSESEEASALEEWSKRPEDQMSRILVDLLPRTPSPGDGWRV